MLWQGSAYGILLSLMYFSAYRWLVQQDWPREDYNYAYFVPVLVLYLAWELRGRWRREPAAPAWGGFLVLMPGILLFLIGELAGEYFSQYLSSWLVVVGLLWIHTGRRKVRTMTFPIFLALFMFPLPHFINTKLSFNLKLLSSEIGVRIIQFLDISAYREGNVIDLGFTQLQVVDACSGLRYLFPLLLMGILMAYFYRAATWKRCIIALSTIPLAIITNSLRIALTAVLYPVFGRAAAEGFFHDFSGWAIFMISFAVLIAEIWLLGRIAPRPGESFWKKQPGMQDGRDDGAAKPELPGRAPEWVAAGSSLLQPRFLAATGVLAATLVLLSAVDLREQTPISRPFNAFPLAVGSWTGERQFLEQRFIDELDFSDYVSVNYSKPGEAAVNLYVAYYASQTKGKSIHSPETCLPGSGWIFRNAGAVTISLPGNVPSSLTAMRAVMERGGIRQLVYFWFKQRDRVLTSTYEVKFYNLVDALVRNRTDGALIRIISPITSSERVQDVDSRLQSFLKEVSPLLAEFLPG
jgi:exosortase D (VPLPA-CTERM-specific)